METLKTDGHSPQPLKQLVAVVHTSVPFGKENLEKDKEEIGKLIEVTRAKFKDTDF